MSYEAIKQVLQYCDEQGCPVQITGPSYDIKFDWVADFRNDVHATVCHKELKAAGHDVVLNPTIGLIHYYARIV